MKSLTNKQITIINKYIEYIKVLYMNRGNGYSINVIIKAFIMDVINIYKYVDILYCYMPDIIQMKLNFH